MRLAKLILVSVVSIGIIFLTVPKVSADETSELILKLLIKKGIISQREVDALKAEVKKVEAKKPAKDFRVYWKEGLRLDTKDKKFKLKVGGRIMTDAGWMRTDSALHGIGLDELDHETEVRRARLYTSGKIYDKYFYKLQFDFAGGDADLKDAYMGIIDVPYIGNIKAGHFKEPFSLEELTSSKYITFMERALPNTFAPGRNTGIGAYSTFLDKRATWAIGAFYDADAYGDASSNEYNVTARTTWLPWYEERGKKLLHVGASYSFRNPERTVRYRERPEAHLAPRFVDTGSIATDYANVFGEEAALVYGPFSVQGELMQSVLDRPSSATVDNDFLGAYGQVSYFLTGEHRNYKKSTGAFSRVKPHKNFSFEDRTPGAWEVAARYSYVDLVDADVRGGILSNATVGLNWYLNPNMRVMGNYIRSHRNDVGDADLFLTRFQVDF